MKLNSLGVSEVNHNSLENMCLAGMHYSYVTGQMVLLTCELNLCACCIYLVHLELLLVIELDNCPKCDTKWAVGVRFAGCINEKFKSLALTSKNVVS